MSKEAVVIARSWGRRGSCSEGDVVVTLRTG